MPAFKRTFVTGWVVSSLLVLSACTSEDETGERAPASSDQVSETSGSAGLIAAGEVVKVEELVAAGDEASLAEVLGIPEDEPVDPAVVARFAELGPIDLDEQTAQEVSSGVVTMEATAGEGGAAQEWLVYLQRGEQGWVILTTEELPSS